MDVEVRNLLGLARAATDLWEEEVDAKWSILVCEEGLEFGDLLAQPGYITSVIGDTVTRLHALDRTLLV